MPDPIDAATSHDGAAVTHAALTHAALKNRPRSTSSTSPPSARPSARRALAAAVFATIGVASAGAASASAAPAAFDPPAGSAATFTYAGGGSQTGAFGDPTVAGDRLNFFPPRFVADSTGGDPATSGTPRDRLFAVLTAAPGLDLSAVSIRLIGDYSALRGGVADAEAMLRVTPLELAGGGTDGFAPYETFVDFPSLPATASGSFDAVGSVSLSPGVRSARVEIDAELFAFAGEGRGASFVQLKNAILSVETSPSADTPPAVVPLPAGALAAIPAGLIAAGAMRRKRRA